MDVLIQVMNFISYIFNYQFNIYGYNISFLNIFAFLFVASASALFIKRLLD